MSNISPASPQKRMERWLFWDKSRFQKPTYGVSDMKLTHLSLLVSNIAYGIVLNTAKYMLMCVVSVFLAWTVWFFVTISVFSKMCWLIVLNSYTCAIKITIPLHVQHCYSSVTTQRLHPECACCIWTILDNVAITTSWSGTVCHGKNSHTKPRAREVK